jgi:cytosine/adenosine deaminase-related metal-dependent hydrolase
MDLFAEVRLAAAAAPFSPRAMLRLVTAEGAAALGIADAGEIRPGAWGDVAAVGLHRTPLAGATDPEAAVALTAGAADVVGTWVAGVPRYRAGAWPGVDADAARRAFAAAHRRAQAVATAVPGAADPLTH